LLINLTNNEYTLSRGDNITISCDYTAFGIGGLGLKRKDRFQAKIVYHDNVDGSLPDLATAEIISDVSVERDSYDTYYSPGSIGPNDYACTSWDIT
jgi:hypothetical protein